MMIFYLTFWLHFHASLALKIVGVVVPSEVIAGRDALLQCHYDLEGSSLYALKWYKGSHEFYRFILKEVPPVQTFPWSSSITIHHEETRSRLFAAPLAGRVLLRNVTASAEGVYKCEVSTEAPYFDTDYEEANLSVIEVASENPIISWVQGRPDWEYDDVFHFKCSMNGTRPASRLSWLFNGQPVPLSMVEPYDPVLIKSESAVRYYSAQLGLRFKMEPHLLLSAAHVDRFEVTCVSRVGLRKGGGGGGSSSSSDALIEGRAKWLVQRPAAATTGIRLQAAPVAGSTVDNWPAENDDDVGGGGRVKEEDDDDMRLGNKQQHQEDEIVSLEADDANAQSDSENPSRRTQPVVGSHPGRVDNKSSAVNSGNKMKGPLARLHLFSSTSGILIILVLTLA
ncbi:uncharacterized protein LOC130689416 [Daphnia carinata]|uniref:uncharacterized protein LOC130689416 n=1 Tax=Daphnia carinata TaxID=120202 RepID=UPI00257CC856|nr:uncharacterized protein LOC130689416 [Daphnia carinata]